jgi:hypothetical protein
VRRSDPWLAVILLVACGPSVVADPDPTANDGTSATSEGDDDPTTASSVGTTPDPSTTMPGTTVDPSEGEADSGMVDDGLFTNPFDLDPVITGCSIWERDCPPGMKCMPYANDGGPVWNDTICSAIADEPGQLGDPCSAWDESPTSGHDDCDFHSMCWDVDPVTFEGTCVGFCTGSPFAPTCEDPATECVQTGSGILTLCLPRCHPIDDPCPAGATCLPASDTFTCARAGGGVGLGEACEFLNSCDPGLICLAAEVVPGCMAEACCAAFCDTAAADPCPGAGEGIECVAWFEDGEAPPGYEELGACVLP